MILFFADVHLDHKLYHTLTDDNITTSELYTRLALNKVWDRATDNDIDMIICAGDFFNNPKPSSESIRWAITWFEEMDKLGKPFYIIPGNHDVGAYSHSMVFIKSLNLQNVKLIEENRAVGIKNGWNVFFLPFLNPSSLKNKYADTVLSIEDFIANEVDPKQKNIIVTHVQETMSKIGAERSMFARAVEVVDAGSPQYENTLFLSGHMHMHQMYDKYNGFKVAYPGSLTFMDITDCGQRKGYLLVSDDGQVTFEPITGIRVFKRYIVPKGKTPIDFFKSIRMSRCEVVFVELQDEEYVNEAELRSFLKEIECSLGKIIYPSMAEAERINVSIETKSPDILLEGYLQKKFESEPAMDWRTEILPVGKELLSNENKHD